MMGNKQNIKYMHIRFINIWHIRRLKIVKVTLKCQNTAKRGKDRLRDLQALI